jgi:serralysin
VTILHEIGHALGLKHPFEPGNSGKTLDPDFNSYTHTIMSYSPVVGEQTNTVSASLYPTTFMFLDLLALEKLYGPPTNVNAGDTTYTFYDNVTYWECIVDSGGKDTVRYMSASDNAYIDLSNDTFSQMGRPVVFDNGQYYNYDTIAFGPSTVIENAFGGGGSDTLIGNSAANKLLGNGGNDRLTGNAGNDNLSGGPGSDKVNGGPGNDRMTWGAGDAVNGAGGRDTLKLAENLDLTVRIKKVLGTEQVDMRGGGIDTLALNRADVLELSSTTNNIRIFGDAGDRVDIVGSFSRGAVSGGFRSYSLGGGALLTVETDVLIV